MSLINALAALETGRDGTCFQSSVLHMTPPRQHDIERPRGSRLLALSCGRTCRRPPARCLQLVIGEVRASCSSIGAPGRAAAGRAAARCDARRWQRHTEDRHRAHHHPDCQSQPAPDLDGDPAGVDGAAAAPPRAALEQAPRPLARLLGQAQPLRSSAASIGRRHRRHRSRISASFHATVLGGSGRLSFMPRSCRRDMDDLLGLLAIDRLW